MATPTQLSNQDEVEQLRNELYKWLQGDAETSVYCAKKAKPASPSLFGGSMSPWLHLLSGNLLLSAAAPAPKEASPLSAFKGSRAKGKTRSINGENRVSRNSR